MGALRRCPGHARAVRKLTTSSSSTTAAAAGLLMLLLRLLLLLLRWLRLRLSRPRAGPMSTVSAQGGAGRGGAGAF